MIMLDHEIGNQMIDVVQTASTVDMFQEENNDYREQVYKTAYRLAAMTLVLMGPDSIVAHQAMSAPMDMATLYETFRMHGGPFWSMLTPHYQLAIPV